MSLHCICIWTFWRCQIAMPWVLSSQLTLWIISCATRVIHYLEHRAKENHFWYSLYVYLMGKAENYDVIFWNSLVKQESNASQIWYHDCISREIANFTISLEMQSGKEGEGLSRSMYEGLTDKAKGGKEWGWKVGVGWGREKREQLYLNNNKKKRN